MHDVLLTPVLAGLLLALPGAACVGAAVAPDPAVIPPGAWAGEGARVVVSAAGAEFAFHCGAGRAEPPFGLDSQGRFDLPGWFERQAGPEPHRRVDARYRGRIVDETMSLAVFAAGGERLDGPFALTLGGSAPPPGACR